MSTSLPVLGFVGIGLMGKPMTLRLLQAGFTVNVWNRSAEKLLPVIEAGAKPCNDLRQLAQTSDIILLCLADSLAVRTVVEDHFLRAGVTAKLIIDLSSIDPATTRDLAQQAALQHIGWVDAPVSGGVPGAEQGTLAIMAGGSAEHILIARQVLAPLYQQLTHMGAIGSGQVTKICNQMLVSCNALVIAEMLALAERNGVDTTMLAPALAGGFADSKPLQILAPEMARSQFEPIKWRVKTLLKDLNMANELAKQHQQAIPMSGLAAQLMQLHGSNGYLEQDPATLIKLYRQTSH